MGDISVYKMNDYEWWTSKLSADDTEAFYEKEIGEKNDIEDIKECGIDKEGMWWTLDHASKENEEAQIEFAKTNGENIKGSKQNKSFGDLIIQGCDIFKYIPLREAIERSVNIQSHSALHQLNGK
jgi:hypothetical protein